MLPNFFIIGAVKSGSTSLYHYLRHHPQIYMSEWKEPEFFLEVGNWKGTRWEYERLFDGAGDARAVGEASVRYAGHPMRPGAPERIAALIPDAKLIYLVREPVARMASQWVLNLRACAEHDPLEIALRKPRYILHSSYAYQAERFLEHFRHEQLLIVQTERLQQDPGPTLDRIFRFLGVEEGHRDAAQAVRLNQTHELFVPRPRVRALTNVRGGTRVIRALHKPAARPLWALTHQSARTPAVPAELAAELRERLRDDVARLRDYAEPSFDGWGIA